MTTNGQPTRAPRRPSRLGQALQRLVTNTHSFLYRVSGGAIGGRMLGSQVLLLITQGRKTGRRRTTPLLYLPDGDTFVLVASNGGSDWTPAWWLNLQRTPRALVQVGRRVVPVEAAQASPAEKARLWPLVTRMYSGYDDYQRRTSREIPLVILRPRVG